jgi:hypothetical protein
MNQVHYPFWPKRLPKILPVLQVPLQDLLETSARRFPNCIVMVLFSMERNLLGPQRETPNEWTAVERPLLQQLVVMGLGVPARG